MGVFDRFMNSIRVNNDDYDEDEEFYDEDDDYKYDDEDEEVEEKPKKGFFKRILGGRSKDDYDEDDFDDDEDDDFDEDEEPAPKKSFFKRNKKEKEIDYDEPETKSYSSVSQSKVSKVTPMKKRSGKSMEVHVIKPTNMEDTREIADTLLAGCTVVLNLEGLDVEIAQRVIDFSSGACYSINGNLQKVSSYIFILTPQSVGITGDITDILNSSIPSMRHNL